MLRKYLVTVQYAKMKASDLKGCGKLIPDHAQPCLSCDQDVPGSPSLFGKGLGSITQRNGKWEIGNGVTIL